MSIGYGQHLENLLKAQKRELHRLEIKVLSLDKYDRDHRNMKGAIKKVKKMIKDLELSLTSTYDKYS